MSAKIRRFEGKTVMVTGAGTGFGSELAVRAGEEGAITGRYMICDGGYSMLGA